MSIYTIEDLEKLSGINKNRIRLWIENYDLFTPITNEANNQFYDTNHLKKLVKIGSLMQSGIPISELTNWSENDLKEKISHLISNPKYSSELNIFLVNDMIHSAISFNEREFNQTFDASIKQLGWIKTYSEVIYPVLYRIGLMWSHEQLIPAQEHFISNLIKQKIYAAIDQTFTIEQSNEIWLLFLPENEEHEIGLLIASLILHQKNKKVVYLGQRIPYSNLNSVINELSPNRLLFFIVQNDQLSSSQQLINKLNKDFPNIQSFIAGNFGLKAQLSLPEHFIWLDSFEALINYC